MMAATESQVSQTEFMSPQRQTSRTPECSVALTSRGCSEPTGHQGTGAPSREQANSKETEARPPNPKVHRDHSRQEGCRGMCHLDPCTEGPQA